MPDSARSKNGQGERKSRQRSTMTTTSGPSTETVSASVVLRHQIANLLWIEDTRRNAFACWQQFMM